MRRGQISENEKTNARKKWEEGPEVKSGENHFDRRSSGKREKMGNKKPA